MISSFIRIVFNNTLYLRSQEFPPKNEFYPETREAENHHRGSQGTGEGEGGYLHQGGYSQEQELYERVWAVQPAGVVQGVKGEGGDRERG